MDANICHAAFLLVAVYTLTVHPWDVISAVVRTQEEEGTGRRSISCSIPDFEVALVRASLLLYAVLMTSKLYAIEGACYYFNFKDRSCVA